jgi:hypothetical protein
MLAKRSDTSEQDDFAEFQKKLTDAAIFLLSGAL